MVLTIAQADRGLIKLKQMKEEQRVALIVGNNNYTNLGKLKNPINDARLMKKVLKKRGFEIIYKENATKNEMKKLVKKFSHKLARGGIGLYYFAGHGVSVDGRNYLVGINSSMDDKDEVEYETLALNYVTKKMKNSGNRLNIVILDACRNNPFERGGENGLAPISNAKGMFIAYVTEAGSVASDGGSGKNGVFTKYLVKHLQERGATIEKVFKNTRADVEDATDGKQSPGVYNQIRGDFFFTLPNGTADLSVAKPSKYNFNTKVPTHFSLTINTTPHNAKVYITNITPKYYDGIKLKKGTYNIKVKKSGYLTKEGSIELSRSESIDIVLEKENMVYKTKFTKRYSSSKNVTVIDDLMWQDEKYTEREKKAYSADRHIGKAQYWKGAISYCKNLTLAGYDDWKLPNKKTLKELFNNKNKLKNTFPNYYWSSTKYEEYKDYAWRVSFSKGYVDSYRKEYSSYVRCVRGGQ